MSAIHWRMKDQMSNVMMSYLYVKPFSNCCLRQNHLRLRFSVCGVDGTCNPDALSCAALSAALPRRWMAFFQFPSTFSIQRLFSFKVQLLFFVFTKSINQSIDLPSRLEISELCILGLSWAILRRWPLDQTMNAFIGLLMWSLLLLWWWWWLWWILDVDDPDPKHILAIFH